MPIADKPTEFGGKVQKNGIQPRKTPINGEGHEPSASEKLRLIYTTGQDADSTLTPDGGVSFHGDDQAQIDALKANLAKLPRL